MTAEQYIFQMCGVESWTELWEKAPEIEFIQALMAEGIVSSNSIRNRMVQEQVDGAVNKRAIIAELAKRYSLSESAIRHAVYRR